MKLIEVQSSESEPEWDDFSASVCDFRPHFNGNLVNVFTTIRPKETPADTESLAIGCARTLAGWLLEHRKHFGNEDRFQIIVGWNKAVRATGRQIVKTGGEYDDLDGIASGTREVRMHGNWTANVFGAKHIEPGNSPKSSPDGSF